MENDTSRVTSPRGRPKKSKTKLQSLDGVYKSYTIAVLIAMSLGITVLAFERGFLTGRSRDRSLWIMRAVSRIDVAARRILRSLLLLLAAATTGAVAYLILVPNLQSSKYQTDVQIKRWVFYSLCGLISANVLAMFTVSSAERAFSIDRDDSATFESPVAHYVLIVSFILATFVMDILYFRVILIPFVETQNEDKQTRARQRWAKIRNAVQSNPEALLGNAQDSNSEENAKPSRGSRISNGILNAIDKTADWSLKCTQKLVEYLQEKYDSVQHNWKRYGIIRWLKAKSIDSSNLFIGALAGVRDSKPVVWTAKLFGSVAGAIGKGMFWLWNRLKKWAKNGGDSMDGAWYKRMTFGVIKVSEGSVTSIKHIKPRLQRFGQRLWDNIKEEEDFTHSSWVKAAVISSFIILLYLGLILVTQFHGFYFNIYKPSRDCLLSNPELTDLFVKAYSLDRDQVDEDDFPAGFQFQAAQIAVTNNELVTLENCGGRQIPESLLEIASAYLEQLEEAEEDELSEPREFSDSTIGKMGLMLDVMLEHLAWSSWVGFSVGLVIGVYSLLSIFAQYKRVSFAIRTGLFKDLPKDVKTMAVGSILDNPHLLEHEKWDKVLSSYPLSLSIFFFGILVSTAVVQLVVFGTLVAILISFFVSLGNSAVLDIMRPFIAFLVAFIVSWLINGLLATMVVGESWLLDRHTIVHEMWFLLFLLVYTAVHLVLGVFYAIIRILLLLMSTFSKISRLDRNLFITWRARDLGHKSFISMVFLHHAFQQVKKPDPGVDVWINALTKLRHQRTLSAADDFQNIDLDGPDQQRRLSESDLDSPVQMDRNAFGKARIHTGYGLGDNEVDNSGGSASVVVHRTDSEDVENRDPQTGSIPMNHAQIDDPPSSPAAVTVVVLEEDVAETGGGSNGPGPVLSEDLNAAEQGADVQPSTLESRLDRIRTSAGGAHRPDQP